MKSLFETIREFGDTQGELARMLGVTESTLSWKINGRSEFRQSEIKAIADRYDLTGEEIKSMFFS
jgi:transcriptional regulator with XRE-family HTH domain